LARSHRHNLFGFVLHWATLTTRLLLDGSIFLPPIFLCALEKERVRKFHVQIWNLEGCNRWHFVEVQSSTLRRHRVAIRYSDKTRQMCDHDMILLWWQRKDWVPSIRQASLKLGPFFERTWRNHYYYYFIFTQRSCFNHEFYSDFSLELIGALIQSI
jgi:hypothetical protein